METITVKNIEEIEAYAGARWVTCTLPGGERAGMLYGAAAQHGVPAILAESGGRGLPIEGDIQRHVDGSSVEFPVIAPRPAADVA